MKRFSSILLLVLLAALSAPACSDDDNNANGDIVVDAGQDAHGSADAKGDASLNDPGDADELDGMDELDGTDDPGDADELDGDDELDGMDDPGDAAHRDDASDASDASDATFDDTISDGDATDGDATDGDATDGDATDGDATDGDIVDEDALDPPVGGIPDQITTEGAEFEGVIPANDSVDVTLLAENNDRVVIWLRVENNETWDAELALYPEGSTNSLVFSNKQNGEDAHIPYQDDELSNGYMIFGDGPYRLELANASDVDGTFKFTLECLSGPCDGSDPGSGGNEHDEDYYNALNNDELREALKATHNSHQSLGYNGARDFMFQYDMDHVGAQDEIECIYTGRTAFITGRMDAQTQTPMWNTEHTWPQSRGASGTAKSDLHHLFVIDANINSKRGNYTFDYVVDVDYAEGGSKLGQNAAGHTRFEVREETRGNVARAIFYFAVVYDFPIDADEEAALRQWHDEDPVDDAERARNDAVEGVQNNRNFFIDWPHLIDQIDDF